MCKPYTKIKGLLGVRKPKDVPASADPTAPSATAPVTNADIVRSLNQLTAAVRHQSHVLSALVEADTSEKSAPLLCNWATTDVVDKHLRALETTILALDYNNFVRFSNRNNVHTCHDQFDLLVNVETGQPINHLPRTTAQLEVAHPDVIAEALLQINCPLAEGGGPEAAATNLGQLRIQLGFRKHMDA